MIEESCGSVPKEVDKLLECQQLLLLTGVLLFSTLISAFQEL
jgi:hypothetical protein